MLAATRAPGSAMTALRRVADLWCACWFWAGTTVPQPGPAEFGDLAAALRSGAASLPASIVQPRLDEAQRIADERRFLHWTLEFPEVFFDREGAPLDAPGFDAILGNPPWEMVRGDTGEGEARGARRSSAALLTRFVRQSGVYRACAEGHANQYQLFVERSISLLRRGGRLGLVLPWGLASDHGSAALRRLLFERCDTDAIVGFENSGGIFPIHRGVRFLLLSTSPGRTTREVRCRLGERDPAVLDEADHRPNAAAARDRGVTLTPALLRRLSGPGLAIPYFTGRPELQLVERLVAAMPRAGRRAGMGSAFRTRVEPQRRQAAVLAPQDRHAGRRGQAHRSVRRAARRLRSAGRESGRPSRTRASGGCAPAPARVPRRGVGDQPADAHLGHRAAGRDHGAHAVLPQGSDALRRPDRALLHAEQLRGELPGAIVGDDPPRDGNGRALAGAEASRGRPWSPSVSGSSGATCWSAGGRHPAAYAEAQGLAALLYGLTPAEFSLVLESFPLVEARRQGGRG